MKPWSNQRLANRNARTVRIPPAITRKTSIGIRPNAFRNPWTVCPGRRCFVRQTMQKALAASNRSDCESPQHHVISSNTITSGWVCQRDARRLLARTEFACFHRAGVRNSRKESRSDPAQGHELSGVVLAFMSRFSH